MADRPERGHTVARLVSELPGAPVGTDERVVALTFDDGPHPRWTPAVLDALAACRARASFFVLGELVAENTDLIRRIVREGHTVGSHSWSHPRSAAGADADDALEREVLRTVEVLRDLTGAPARYFRPPYKKTDAPRIAAVVSRHGIATVTWSVDPRDWGGGDAREITEAVLGALHPGAIVLLHDGGRDRAATVRAVPMIVDGVRDRGYRLVAL